MIVPHSCAQAVAAVVARGELEALSAWASEVELAIERPLRDYAHFVDACFGPFSVQIAKASTPTQFYEPSVTHCIKHKTSRTNERTVGPFNANAGLIFMLYLNRLAHTSS